MDKGSTTCYSRIVGDLIATNFHDLTVLFATVGVDSYCFLDEKDITKSEKKAAMSSPLGAWTELARKKKLHQSRRNDGTYNNHAGEEQRIFGRCIRKNCLSTVGLGCEVIEVLNVFKIYGSLRYHVLDSSSPFSRRRWAYTLLWREPQLGRTSDRRKRTNHACNHTMVPYQTAALTRPYLRN